MNFGQMLASLLNGNSATRDEMERESCLEAVQRPTGIVTEPFLVQRFPNGECWVYLPTMRDIFATNWRNIANEGHQAASQAITEHAGARS